MRALADMEAKFGGLSVRPTNEEIDMCQDHRLEVEERSPDNPVDPDLFSESRWKAVQKARGTIAEKLTQSQNGLLSLDPAIMDKQLVLFEKDTG